MKIGDFVEWCDQTNYPGLCGIVTKTTFTTDPTSRQIFVHWWDFCDYAAGEGWEKVRDVVVISAAPGETK